VINPRQKKFLEALPRNGNKIKPSAIEAGYSPIYAHANGKTILKTAIKAQAQEIIENIDQTPTKEAKKMMYELMGMTDTEVINNAKYLLNQEKDLSTRLKLLAPLLSELGIRINPDDSPKTIVPILNIGIRQLEDGSTEPHNPNIVDTQ
jgi:hypothetical protein